MLRVITANLNGIRAAARKGFFEWMGQQNADIVCVQEIKAKIDQLSDAIFSPSGYHTAYCEAEKKGYSGVGIYSKIKPVNVVKNAGSSRFDSEGRFLQFDFEKYSVVSLYMPSGSSGEIRQNFKFEDMKFIMKLLKQCRLEGREFIICGDWNIAHKKIDIKNWRANQKNSGFLPEERAWMDELFGEAGFVDAFRQDNDLSDQYTWWSNRGNARANNVGWRIDYQVITPGLENKVVGSSIYKDTWFSDHAPLTIDYNF